MATPTRGSTARLTVPALLLTTLAVVGVAAGQESSSELRMRRLGNAGWEISDGQTTVLVDPYLTLYSSETGERREDGTRLPDEDEIQRQLPDVDYVLVTHGHPDHALDATAIARLRGAVLIGSPSVMNIARAYCVADERLITVLGGEDYDFGTLSVRVIPSLHTALFDKRYHNSAWPGRVPPDLEGPLTSHQFKEGKSLAYLIRMSGHEVLAMGSMNYIEREMEGLRPPVVFPTHVDLRRESAREAVRELEAEVERACPSSSYRVSTRLTPITIRRDGKAGPGSSPLAPRPRSP